MYTSTISQILPHFPCTTCLCCAKLNFSSVLCPKTFFGFVTNEIKYLNILFLVYLIFHLYIFQCAYKLNKINFWWAQMESNHRPHAYQACALTIWAMSPYNIRVFCQVFFCNELHSIFNVLIKVHWKINSKSFLSFSLERRWSSRTFRYGYLVTTSPQSLILPSTAASKS